MSYLPQTTLQGRGLDDISWNKAAESAEQSRSCWWACKWAVSAVESGLKKRKTTTPFQYVTGRTKSSLLGRSLWMHKQLSSRSRSRTRRRPSVAPSFLKYSTVYLHRLWQSCKYLRSHLSVLWRRCLGVAGTNPATVVVGSCDAAAHFKFSTIYSRPVPFTKHHQK